MPWTRLPSAHTGPDGHTEDWRKRHDGCFIVRRLRALPGVQGLQLAFQARDPQGNEKGPWRASWEAANEDLP